ncbi:hypothetical protein J6U78_03865 [bacterium]|nr:hypothetical protein [bacterium]
MIKSQVKKHRQAEESDKHLVVNGVENLMVDGRGKCRLFGLTRPKAAPVLEVDESGGELRRDAGYSYCYVPYDSYHNAEGEPSPATAYVKPGSSDDYKTVSVGEWDSEGNYDLRIVKVSGTNLSKVNDHYNGQCIAVLIENDDRPTPYSQWQYRKIVKYTWNGADETGEFEVARPFLNVDTNPEDQQYDVRLSDMDMEEGEVGGKSAGMRKLVLDPNASTDVASYRLKVIRITQGVGKGQSRFIMDASLNSLGQVEITVNKPWKKKPKFVDETLRSVQKKQDSLKTRKDAKPGFFNQNWSSSYVIYDPLRYNGLCFDGEVESRDKKTNRITIAGLGAQQSILSGNVIRFMQGKEGASKMVISLDNANSNADWSEEDSLTDKRLKITSGPGSGREYVITASESSGENSVKVTLGIPKTDNDALNTSGVPTAKSTYVIYTEDSVNDTELTVASISDQGDEYEFTCDWNKKSLFEDNIVFSEDADGDVFLTVTTDEDLSSLIDTAPGKVMDLWPRVLVDGNEVQGSNKVSITLSGMAKGKDGLGNEIEGKYVFLLSKEPDWRKVQIYSRWKGEVITSYSPYKITLLTTTGSSQTYSEVSATNITRIYVNDLEATGLTSTNPDYIDGVYTASIKVQSPPGAGKKVTATITRYVHAIGMVGEQAYIDVIGTLPRMYKRPRKPNTNSNDNAPAILEPMLGEPISIYGANSRDGFYTGWRALFYNTTEIGGNKQKIKCKEARVIASFDATGEIIVDKEIAGVKPGWQVVLYSEYTSCLGSCVNSAEKSIFYRNGKDNLGIYDDYVPLEPFASPEDDAYQGWTLEVLTRGKLKKDGSTKYNPAPTKYRNKQKRTVIKYYGASRRAFVHQAVPDETWQNLNGEPFNPLLNGHEFIWLYDPSTSIEKIFDESDDESVSNEVGVKIKLKGIKRCPLDGVDKIRIYRANEATGAYRLVADIENKDQDWVDNTPEEHLSTEINIGHVAPPPCGKTCQFKGRFILAGAVRNNPTVRMVKGGHASVYAPDYGGGAETANPVIEKYLYTDSSTFTGRALRVGPAVGVLCNKDCGTVIPQTDDTNTEKIKVGLIISDPGADGVIAWCERRQFSGTFQRSVRVSGSHDDKMRSELVESVFLATNASGNQQTYRRSVLNFANADGKKQVWPFYKDASTPRYTAQNRQFAWLDGKTVLVTTLQNTIYPMPFTIRTAVWAIFRRAGEYYYVDAEHSEPQLITSEQGYLDSETGLIYLNVLINQGENFSNLDYHIGGNAAQAVTADLYDFYNGDVLPTNQFRFYAVTFSLENEDIISCYAGADAEVQTYQEANAYKPVMSIPECVENAYSASVYSSTGGIIENPPMKQVLIINGKVYRIAIWDKEYLGTSGTVGLTARENAKAVFFTAATDGDVEKVELAQSFVFNDGYGTDVTAVAPTNNYVVVFKQRAIYALDPDGPSVGLLMNDIGCIATDSVAMGRSGLYWMAEGRRIMRSDFEHGTEYVGAPVQPWFDGYKDFDGWYVDKDNLTDLISTYDVDHDEYIMFVPAKKGTSSRLICLCFCDQFQIWYRVEDDALHSDNKADCAFRFEGCGAYAGAKGIWVNNKKRSGYAAWLWKSIQRDEGNSGVMKHIKRIKILNVITDKEPSGTTGEPEAGFEFYKEMRTTPEGSYQASDAHTVRGVLTNRFAQLVHVGLRAFLWQFKFFGESYVKLFDFVLQYRSKGEAEADGWIDTPN